MPSTVLSAEESPLRSIGAFRGTSVWARWACEHVAETAQARCAVGLPVPAELRYPLADTRPVAERVAGHWREGER